MKLSSKNVVHDRIHGTLFVSNTMEATIFANLAHSLLLQGSSFLNPKTAKYRKEIQQADFSISIG